MEQILSVLTKFRNACAHGERLFSHAVKDDIPDLPLHTKLQIAKRGNQYIQGKRDLFAVVIALRYLLSSDEFKDFKKSIAKQIADFSTECDILEEEKLLQLMGFPLNWKKITAYKL